MGIGVAYLSEGNTDLDSVVVLIKENVPMRGG